MGDFSQRHRRTALPFPYSEDGIELDIEECSLDGRETENLGLSHSERRIDLTPQGPHGRSNGDRPWSEATLSGRIVVPEEVVWNVFPEHERDDPPAKLYVAVRCHETIYRDKSVVSRAPTHSGTYDVDIELNWSDFRGKVELRPYLVRAEEGREDSEFATKPNVRLADGPIYTVLVDSSEREEHSFIDGEEASFSQSPHLPGGDKLYYLDFRNESRPKLWINSDNPRITDVLQSEGSVGAAPRMRDVVLDQVSFGVWTQLIVRTACAVDHEGNVEYEWQRTVVESFARRLYDVDSVTEAALRLRSDVEESGELPHLMERIDKELQEFVNPRTQLINLMEEGLQL